MYVNAVMTTPEGFIILIVTLLVAIFLTMLAVHGQQNTIEHRLEELDKLRRSHLHMMKEFLMLKHAFDKYKKDNANTVVLLKSKETDK